MPLKFEPVSLDQQYPYLEHLAACPQKSSDYSFVNLWGWAEEYGLSWAWSDDLVWIKQTIPEVTYWAPIGSWETVDWNKSFETHFGYAVVFSRVPSELLGLWQDHCSNRIMAEETRGHWDYLYSVSELIALKGKRFHKKKNHLNQFLKKYDFQYTSFGAEIIDQAMAMQADWCTWRDCESFDSLAAENRSIVRILTNWEQFRDLAGGALFIDQKMVAYTVAERLSGDTLLIHFEKANPDYRGVYQAINQMFLEHSGGTFAFVNREQDLDDQGLRKAKLSYHPADFLKKYRVILK